MISYTPVTTDTIIMILTIVGTMSSVLFSIQSSQSFCEVYKLKPAKERCKKNMALIELIHVLSMIRYESWQYNELTNKQQLS